MTLPSGIELIPGDCRTAMRSLPEQSVHCCVTSPPYWGLRDYQHERQLGLEPTPEEFVASMLEVFAEVHRVLRDDGTLWLNLGDSYNASPPGNKSPMSKSGLNGSQTSEKYRKRLEETQQRQQEGRRLISSLKPKDLVGIPWRVAFALQSAGWYLRQDIIWHKPNPMPESVTDRCTKSHEYIFLLSKSLRYYYDSEAIAEETLKVGGAFRVFGAKVQEGTLRQDIGREFVDNGTRNKRSVWTVSTKPYSGAHFATFPEDLIEPCILAGSPETCCSACGKGYVRLVEKERVPTRPGTNSKVNRASADESSPYNGHSGMVVGNRDPHRHTTTTHTVGFEPDCRCGVEPAESTVLDPFSGAGTTGLVAYKHRRKYIGCELNPEYLELSRRRIQRESSRYSLLEPLET